MIKRAHRLSRPGAALPRGQNPDCAPRPPGRHDRSPIRDDLVSLTESRKILRARKKPKVRQPRSE
jgi:hypothetical protein